MAFKLSTKCRYGTRAILEIAKCYGLGPIKRKSIALSQGVSQAYLVNILISLKNSGFIDAVRGAQGGYVLKRPPSKIVLFDIVQALEGSLAPVECLENKNACDRIASCKSRTVWKELMEAQKKVLCSVTLQDILDRKESKGNDFCI
jgi:Rrf2 family cysteine metabolism transcriptional repressor